MLHNHNSNRKISRPLILALVLTFTFAFVEIVGGHMYGSLALIADGGHMISDSLSLFTLLIASVVANIYANSHRFSYGLGKLDVIAAIFNIILVFAIIFHIGSSAIERFQSNQEIFAPAMIGIALTGLAINLIVLKILGELDSLASKSAKLHLISDIMGSIAAVMSGIVIYFTGFVFVDVILSILISAFLFFAAIRQLASCITIMLDAIPDDIDPQEVSRRLKEINNVIDVHDIHIWHSGDKEISFTAHVDMLKLHDWDENLKIMNKVLFDEFGINHTTIQPELDYAKADTEKYH